jgi:hypothetical protein
LPPAGFFSCNRLVEFIYLARTLERCFERQARG